MTKGYIELEEIPKSCSRCEISYYSELELRTCGIEHGKVDRYKNSRPGWCPIKEHDLGVCAEKHKEEMEELHRKATEKVGW